MITYPTLHIVRGRVGKEEGLCAMNIRIQRPIVNTPSPPEIPQSLHLGEQTSS